VSSNALDPAASNVTSKAAPAEPFFIVTFLIDPDLTPNNASVSSH
jgi:hypothetical protein